MTSELDNISSLFPCSKIPEDPGKAKLIGLYQQIQENLWLQRIKVPGGRLSCGQWFALGWIAEEFTPNTPLHLTTRQDIEVHNLAAEQIPQLQEELNKAGLTTFGAAGDTYRNVTVCPCSGAASGTVDLMPLAKQIELELSRIKGIYSLPRKFKISLSCSRDCGQPFINDFGLISVQKDGQWVFRVIIAGSLGAVPGTGILLRQWISAQDVLPLVVASVKLFAEKGDRENRRKARLRHFREKVGDDEFIKLVEEEFEAVKKQGNYPCIELPKARGELNARKALTFVNGDVTSEQANALGEIAGSDSFEVRIANQHQVIVFGPNEDLLAEKLSQFSVLTEPAQPQPVVVACPGKRWCSHALVHTNELADRIRLEFGELLPAGTIVCISGCPNGCSHPRVADIGLTGRIVSENGQKLEAFNLFGGGGMGKDDRLAQSLSTKLSADDVINEIRTILEE